MRLMITGTGRGGTNLTVYFVKHLYVYGNLKQHYKPEDAPQHAFYFCTREHDEPRFNLGNLKKPMRESYCFKAVVDSPVITTESLTQIMEMNPDLHLLFVTRHPCDCLLGKWNRANPEVNISDTDPQSLLNTYQKLIDIHQYAIKNYNKRILTIKMEDILTKPESIVEKIAAFTSFEHRPDWKDTYYSIPKRHNTNTGLSVTYGTAIKTDNFDLYKDIQSNWNGKFAHNQEAKDLISSEEIKQMAKYFGYEI